MFWFSIMTHLLWLILGGRISIYLPESSANATNGYEWQRWSPGTYCTTVGGSVAVGGGDAAGGAGGGGDLDGMGGGGEELGGGGTVIQVVSAPGTPGTVCAMELPNLPWATSVIPLTLLFFFMVFYTNSSFNRFYQLYNHCVGIMGATQEWTALVKSHSRSIAEPERASARWNATRFILAATHLLYYTLYGDKLTDDEYEMIVARDLLTDDECATLKEYKGFKPWVAMCWSLDDVEQLVQRDSHDAGRPPDGVREMLALQEFRDVAFRFRTNAGQIFNLLKQPVPFPYFHLLNCILLVQLLLISYALAIFPTIAPYFSVSILAFVTIVLLGMRGLAVQLSNPFGDDAVDFEIETFMRGAFTNAVAHLKEPDRRVDVCAQPSERMRNPLAADLAPATQAAITKSWATRPGNAGPMKDDDRVLSNPFTDEARRQRGWGREESMRLSVLGQHVDGPAPATVAPPPADGFARRVVSSGHRPVRASPRPLGRAVHDTTLCNSGELAGVAMGVRHQRGAVTSAAKANPYRIQPVTPASAGKCTVVRF